MAPHSKHNTYKGFLIMIILLALTCALTGYQIAKPVIKIKRLILGWMIMEKLMLILMVIVTFCDLVGGLVWLITI